MKTIPVFIAVAVLWIPILGYTQSAINIDMNQKGNRLSPMQYGLFYEEISRSGDGGLYAEMLQNRSFEEFRNGVAFDNQLRAGIMPLMDDPKNIPAWALHGDGTMVLDQSKPLNPNNPTALKIKVNGQVQLINAGFLDGVIKNIWLDGQKGDAEGLGTGLYCQAGASLKLSFYVRAEEPFKTITARLVKKNGALICEKVISGIQSEWKKLDAILTPSTTDVQARLVLTISGTGNIWFDMVSLFPANTYKNRPNGLRPDLAEMLADLKPAFIRFPGGCFVEGLYQLREAWSPTSTIGDVASRPGTPGNRWNYGSTDGLGFHEMLLMCEDMGAEPLFVVNPGMSHGDAALIRTDDLNCQFNKFIEDNLNALEYANGDVTTKWGAMRAANGHPTPFNIKYLEIGNEQAMYRGYDQYYAYYYRLIKEKYPQMNIILGSISLKDMPTNAPVEIVDEHFYESAGWCIENFYRYDGYDRRGPKIYVGEIGVTSDASLATSLEYGNLRTALGEAVYWMNIERNADIVTMISYAPTMARQGWKMWHSQLLAFDQSRVFGLPSYYVYQMFANNKGDINLAIESKSVPAVVHTERTSDVTKDKQRFQDYTFKESLYCLATLDEKNSQVILKVVNFLNTKQTTSITINGVKAIGKIARAEVLAHPDIAAKNTFENPGQVVPVKTTVPKCGKQFSYTFAANSLTFLRLNFK